MNTSISDPNLAERELLPAEVFAQFAAHDDTLDSLLATRAATVPDAEAMVFESRVWTYAQLKSASDALAAQLSREGVSSGDTIAHISLNSDCAVVLFLAVARLGAVFVPLNPALTDDELRYQTQHAGVKRIYARAADLPRMESLIDAGEAATPQLSTLEDIGRDDEDAADIVERLCGAVESLADSLPRPKPDDGLVVIYTSGTTGLPKGVLHTHRNLVWSAEVFVGRLRLQREERLLTVFPLFHVNALFYSFGGALAVGGTFITVPKFSASKFWDLAAATRATQLNILAALGTILALRRRDEFNPAHRIAKIYGGPISQEMFRVFQEEFRVPLLIEGYGMSEIPSSCSNPYDGPQKLGSIGVAGIHPRFPGRFAELRVADDEGRDVAMGEEGELMVRTPIMFKEYLNDPDKTREAFRDGWFCTGDIVRRDNDGYFYFIARKKDIIRKRGENISGAELDHTLARHPQIAEAATIAVPSELGEDEIFAVLVAKPGVTVSPAEVYSWCRDNMAPIKVPRYIAFTDALPKTPTQRVAKHQLKKQTTLFDSAHDMEKAKA